MITIGIATCLLLSSNGKVRNILRDDGSDTFLGIVSVSLDP